MPKENLVSFIDLNSNYSERYWQHWFKMWAVLLPQTTIRAFTTYFYHCLQNKTFFFYINWSYACTWFYWPFDEYQIVYKNSCTLRMNHLKYHAQHFGKLCIRSDFGWVFHYVFFKQICRQGILWNYHTLQLSSKSCLRTRRTFFIIKTRFILLSFQKQNFFE